MKYPCLDVSDFPKLLQFPVLVSWNEIPLLIVDIAEHSPMVLFSILYVWRWERDM